jgi:predicted dehydrogenase
LSSGLPTFVEKPLACASEHARILQQTFGSRVSTSEQRIHRKDLKVVRSLIKSGRLGRLRYIDYQDSVTPTPHFSTTWRNDPGLAGGGILLDLGYHTAGALQWLLGTSSEDFDVTRAHLRHGELRVEQHAEVECTSGGIDIKLDIRLDENRPREVLIIQGSLAQVRVERERKKPEVALITIREVAGNLTIRPIELTADYDTRSLCDFFSGKFNSYHLGRHVRTLEFLEMIYARSGGRASQCS